MGEKYFAMHNQDAVNANTNITNAFLIGYMMKQMTNL